MIDPDGYRPNVGIVLLRDDGRLFWARRINRDGWQFPQGGMRSDETPLEAMYRELQEEIGLTIGPALVWRTQLVDYPHGLVRLHFCKVREWSGELQMHEGQESRWERLPVQCEPVLPGTVPVLRWLQEETDAA